MAFLSLLTLLCLLATADGIVVKKVTGFGKVQAYCEKHQIAIIIHATIHHDTSLNSFCNFSQNCTLYTYTGGFFLIDLPCTVLYSCVEPNFVHATCNRTFKWQGPAEGILTSVETDIELYGQPCSSIFWLNPGQVVVITALDVLEEIQLNDKALDKMVPTVLIKNSTMTYRSVERGEMILLYKVSTVKVSNNMKSCKDSVDDECTEEKGQNLHNKVGVKPLKSMNVEESTLTIQYLSVGGLSLGILATIGLVVVLTLSILTLRRVGYVARRLDQGQNPTDDAGLYENASPTTEAPPASVYTALSKRKRPELGEVYSNV